MATLIAALFAPVAAFGQGKLESVREAVSRPDEPEKPSDCQTDNSNNSSNSSGSSDSGDSLGTYLLLFPWTMPNAMFDAGWRTRCRFTPHPYAIAGTGHMLFDRPSDSTPRECKWDDLPYTQSYSMRASVELGSNFDGLDRAGVRLFFDTDSRLGLKTDWDFYRERLPLNQYDHLIIGDITPTFRFVQSEQLQMHTGLGARLMFDGGSTKAGLNALYGLDAFPVKPLHMFGAVEGGTLGSANVVRLRGGAGLVWSHGEIYGGVDWLKIGDTSLSGPYVGLRLWF